MTPITSRASYEGKNTFSFALYMSGYLLLNHKLRMGTKPTAAQKIRNCVQLLYTGVGTKDAIASASKKCIFKCIASIFVHL